jgi:type II secretory pathway pseudopilin PulG
VRAITLARRLAASEGLTLIELLVAIFLIAIVLVPFVALMSVSLDAARANADRVQAVNAAYTVLESATAIPYTALGYYEDEFSSANSNYPCTAAGSMACTVFNQIFGTDYLPGTTFPFTVPSGAQTVDLGSASCKPTPCTSASQDLIQPYLRQKVGNLDVSLYTVVTWIDTNLISPSTASSIPTTSVSGSCAYKQVTVWVYWRNFTNKSSISTTVDPGGNPPNTAAGEEEASCSSTVTGASSPPSAPTNVVFATNPDPAQAGTTLVVSWQEVVPSGAFPPGYFVVQFTSDPSFPSWTQSSNSLAWSATSPILQATSASLSPSCSPGSGGSQVCSYTFQLSGLAPGLTYYGQVWAYSLNGVGMTPSGPTNTVYCNAGPPSPPPWSSLPPGCTQGVGGVTTSPLAQGSPCYYAALTTYFFPATPPPTSGNPDLSGKLYLTQSGASQENLQFIFMTDSQCSASISPAVGVGFYRPDGTLTPFAYANLSPLAATAHVWAVTIPASNIQGQLPSGYYVVGLYDTAHNPLPSASGQLRTFLLVCPYAPPQDRTQATNQC